MAFNFKRGKTGDAIFSKEALEDFAVKYPGDSMNFTVSSEIRLAANSEILRQARELAFETRRALVDSIMEVAQRNPALFRISRGALASDRTADICVTVAI